MKRSAIVAMLSAIAMLASPTMASATVSGGHAVFTAKATVSHPICYPPGGTPVCSSAKKTPATFTLDTATANVALCVYFGIAPKKGQPASAGTCRIEVGGDLGGPLGGPNCGLSSGSSIDGTVTLTDAVTGVVKTYTISDGFYPLAVGGTIVFVATASKPGSAVGAAVAVVNAVPDPLKSQSCSQATGGPGATEFLVVGTASLVVLGK